MRLAVNLRKFQPGEIGGIENYVRHVVGGIASDRTQGAHELTIFVQDIAVDAIRRFAPEAQLRVVPHHACGLSIAPELDPDAHDVLLCPQLGLDPLGCDLPAVAMIPDLAQREAPASFDPAGLEEREELVAATVARADLILTLSNHSRDALVDAYGLDPERIVVTHCGVDREFLAVGPMDPPTFAALEIPDDYIYFPANFWPHKNHANLLEALALIDDAHPEIQLVLTGAPATGAERIAGLADRLGLTGRVRMLGYQPTVIVAALTRHARALVFPTLYEGFGIPPLEAFNVGTPVLSSGVAGNREVVGDAALLVDPGDPGSIADGIDRILVDDELRAMLARRGRKRATLFSWSHATDAVTRSLTRVAAGSSVSRRRRSAPTPTRVSLLTPILGSARFLSETIDSVLAQEYPYVDYLVVDASPRQDALEVLNAYAGRVRWCSLKPVGEAQTINAGYGQTQGDLFALLAPGYVYKPDTLWRAVAHYDAEPTVAAVFGDVEDATDRAASASGVEGVAADGTVLDEEEIERPIYRSAAFVTRDAFARAGMLDPQDGAACVSRLWERVAQRGGKFRYAARQFAGARGHVSSV